MPAPWLALAGPPQPVATAIVTGHSLAVARLAARSSTPQVLISFAARARVVVRNPRWIARRADPSFDSSQQLKCDGIP